MKLFQSLTEATHTLKLKGVTDEKIKNAFFANFLAGLLMLRVQDLAGLKMINDSRHADLKQFGGGSMSDINFWGRAMFCPDSPELKNLMAAGTDEKLLKVGAKISKERVKKLLKIPTTNPEHINWNDTVAALALFKHCYGLKSSWFDHILVAIHKWDTLSVANKHKAFGDALLYLMQADADGKLLQRLRVLHNKWLLKPPKQKMIFKKLKDKPKEKPKSKKKSELKEDGAATGAGSVASGGGGNAIVNPASFSAKAMSGSSGTNHCKVDLSGLFRIKKKAPNQVTDKKTTDRIIKNNKIIKKRAKNFKPIKWKAPAFMKKSFTAVKPGGEPGMKKV
jgi:hypothetical protein